jgi:hypothetical protein
MTGRVIRNGDGSYRYDDAAVTPLPEGTRVRVKDDAQPVYLRGRTGIIKRARVVYEIDWDDPGRMGHVAHLPTSLSVPHEYLTTEHGR